MRIAFPYRQAISQAEAMQKIPASKDTLVVRTGFSDEDAWKAICLEIEKPVGDFQAYVRFISDPPFDASHDTHFELPLCGGRCPPFPVQV